MSVVGNWFGHGKKGLIMGLWNSHTSIGNILGTAIASKNFSLNVHLPFRTIMISHKTTNARALTFCNFIQTFQVLLLMMIGDFHLSYLE